MWGGGEGGLVVGYRYWVGDDSGSGGSYSTRGFGRGVCGMVPSE